MSEREARLPPRPMIASSLWVLAATYGCQQMVAWMSFFTDESTLRSLALASLAGALAIVGCMALGYLRNREARLGIARTCLAIVLLGIVGSAVTGIRQVRCNACLRSHAVSALEFTVSSDPTTTLSGYRYRTCAYLDGRRMGDVWMTAKERLERGDAITCVGRYKSLEDDDYGHSSWRQGVSGSVVAVRVLACEPARGPYAGLLDLRRSILRALGASRSRERALLAGCVCGSREELKGFGIDEEFSTCGMAHIIAVSGAHLALVSALLAGLLEHTRLNVAGRVTLLVATTGLYVLFCGAPLSAVRAWLMALAASCSQLCGRRAHALSSVCLVALMIVLAEPAAGGQMGFELSVLSVVGLCLLSPYVAYALEVLAPNPRLPRWVARRVRRRIYVMLDGAREGLAATLVCQAATLPVTIGAFGKLSLIAPVANVLVAPLISPLLAIGLLACAFAWCAPLCQALLLLCDLVSHSMLVTAARLSAVPYASVSVAGMGPFLLLLLMAVLVLPLALWPRLARRPMLRVVGTVMLVGCLVVMRWRFFAPARMVVLDVGQGDAILVQDGASTLLVDTGPDDAVVDALARQHVMHLDAVLLTHLHDDHYGGLAYLKGAVTCDKILVARGVRLDAVEGLQDWCTELTQVAPEELSYGDVLSVGGYGIRMIWPREQVDGSENAHSVELLATFDRGGRRLSALLTGDAEQDETGACVTAGDVGDIDVLKVGHHGSEVSLTSEQAKALDPEVSVASAGEDNSYGHPSPTCVGILEDAGSIVLCTKDVGDVIVSPGHDGPVVRCQPTPRD